MSFDLRVTSFYAVTNPSARNRNPLTSSRQKQTEAVRPSVHPSAIAIEYYGGTSKKIKQTARKRDLVRDHTANEMFEATKTTNDTCTLLLLLLLFIIRISIRVAEQINKQIND